jgi:hypothetical protein
MHTLSEIENAMSQLSPERDSIGWVRLVATVQIVT